ncbi:MAG: hypothetical protein KDD75_06120, partial [Caldilineaceae bacterium]|nr:hypothetical protein [Caldilineaceae bacterium]
VVSALVTDGLRRTLLYLHDRGYALSLIALGQACSAAPVPGVRTYAIGGREAWHDLTNLSLA